jgi:hypothetical protein
MLGSDFNLGWTLLDFGKAEYRPGEEELIGWNYVPAAVSVNDDCSALALMAVNEFSRSEIYSSGVS